MEDTPGTCTQCLRVTKLHPTMPILCQSCIKHNYASAITFRESHKNLDPQSNVGLYILG